jgi:hypothetical protein
VYAGLVGRKRQPPVWLDTSDGMEPPVWLDTSDGMEPPVWWDASDARPWVVRRRLIRRSREKDATRQRDATT